MIPGFSSTGSKRPDLLFGTQGSVPQRMVRSNGCRIWDDKGQEYIDFIMALGAVSLGYAHPKVVAATQAAIRDGGVGSLAPTLEAELAEKLGTLISGFESVRFLKTGAEAVAGAIRIARVETGREIVVASGYHGWLDPMSLETGVPQRVKELRLEVPFNDVEALLHAFDGRSVAALLLEPVVDTPPTAEWVEAVRTVQGSSGCVVILDEIKTGLRLGWGGGQERWSYPADLVVMGKALANGFPLAVVGGNAGLMDAATRTWISSTLATEYVSLAAALAVLQAFEEEDVHSCLQNRGGQFYLGLEEIAASAPTVVKGVRGIPEFCYLQFTNDEVGCAVAARCAGQGLLFKRNAYNFVSLAHDELIITESLACVAAAVEEIGWGG